MSTLTIPEQINRSGYVISPPEPTALNLIEMMLKDTDRLDEMTREESRASELVPRFLGIAVLGFTVFGIAVTVILNLLGDPPSWVPETRWTDFTVLSLTLAYVLGLIGATGVCLPSFYFYGLLAGVSMSMVQATAHAAKGLAVSALALVGVLPIYVAAALGTIIFEAPGSWKQATIALGLALPFISGLWGVRSLYRGFMGLAETLPPCRRERRRCFLRRLTLAWACCYTVVTPVIIVWLWTRLAG
ncbi:hypothetical protein BH23PLA1_BH23PLA1_06880 [soil metagenome]